MENRERSNKWLLANETALVTGGSKGIGYDMLFPALSSQQRKRDISKLSPFFVIGLEWLLVSNYNVLIHQNQPLSHLSFGINCKFAMIYALFIAKTTKKDQLGRY